MLAHIGVWNLSVILYMQCTKLHEWQVPASYMRHGVCSHLRTSGVVRRVLTRMAGRRLGRANAEDIAARREGPKEAEKYASTWWGSKGQQR